MWHQLTEKMEKTGEWNERTPQIEKEVEELTDEELVLQKEEEEEYSIYIVG